MRGSLLLKRNCYGEMEGPEMLVKLMEYQQHIEGKQAPAADAVRIKRKIHIDVTEYSRENQVYHGRKTSLLSRLKTSLNLKKR